MEKHLEVALGNTVMGNFQSQLKLKSLFSSFGYAISGWLYSKTIWLTVTEF